MVLSTMLIRALFLALSCVCVYAHIPLTAGDEECALYLSGPGRTSAYDYSLNLLRGNFAYEGQSTCITYEAINQAYLEARKRILVAQPKGDWTPEDYASVGELVLDISTNLARRYGLTYEEIEKGLPLIDTSRTLIAEVCPPVFSHVECRAGKYRRLDGLCNNLQHPTWGSTNVPFQRLIGPLFADGINSPRIAHSGRDLPLSRVVSRTIHPDEGFHDHAGTVMVIAWGQFMDHDYTLTATPLDPRNRNDPEECCKRSPHQKHPYCNEIRIPDDDYFYRLFGVKCIDFVRAFPSPRPGCRLGSRIPYNTLTGVLDGNTVYGVTDKFARKLRTGYGGLLRMNDVFKEYGLKDLLPLKLDIPDEGCTRPNKNMYCFEAGEIRVNEQLVLTVMHTLMAREHNRVAKGLAEVNPHWDDETLYQEARRINIAEIQHITYNEFLPILLGKDVMEKFGLVLEKEGYWDGYDPEVNPDVIASFASAAYRFGHSLLPTAIERWSKAHKFIASKRLSDLIRRPYDLYRAGVLDEYIMGLMNQVAQAMDDSITQEVTNHLFKKVGARFGMDLVSFNMQRGREFGIPGYMEFRKFCGLSGADTFQDLFGSMPNDTVRKYESIFEHPNDVDLWSGGVSERPLPGSMLGPTFACIIATQFSYSRRGDRFWYELPNQPSSFTTKQLKEIRKARMARVICDNTDIIDTVQLYPMVLPDHELNPRVPCRSGIIPSMDFSAWAEQPPFPSPAKQFNTEAIIENKTITAWPQSMNETKCNENNNSEACYQNIKKNDMPLNTITTAKDKGIEIKTTPTNTTGNNFVGKTDTVLKFVYKNDKEISKNIPHFKNSLNRRKRSTNSREDIKPHIVNYETNHSNEDEAKHPELQKYEIFPPAPELTARPRDTESYIKTADLASFDIKTLHDHIVNPRFKDAVDEISNERSEEKHDAKNKDEIDDVIRGKISYHQDSSDDKEKNSLIQHKKPYGSMYSQFHPEALLQPKYISTKNIDSDETNEENYDRSLSDDEKLKSEENSDRDDGNAYRKQLQYVASELESKKPESHENDNNSSSEESLSTKEPRENSKEKSRSQFRAHPKESDGNSSEDDRSDSREVIEVDSQEKTHFVKYPLHKRNDEYIEETPQRKQYSDNSKENISNNYDSNERHPVTSSNERHDNQILNGDKVDDPGMHFYKPLNSRSNYHNANNDDQEVDEKESKQPSDSEEVDLNDKESADSAEEQQSNENNSVINNENGQKSQFNDRSFFYNGKPKRKDKDLNDFNSEQAINDNDSGEHVSSESSNDSPTSNEDSSSNQVSTPVKINDGEIKPVVEIRSENNSESVEDDVHPIDLHDYKGKQIPINSAEDPIKEKLSAAITKLQSNKSVKQEFERIPLDYQHDKNKEENKSNSDESKEPNYNDDTRDTPPPDKSRYDENLDFKFSNPAIKLPEIILPEDILTYDDEEDKTNNKKNKAKFYHYDNEKDPEDKEIEKENENRQNEDEDDNEYYHTEPSESLRQNKDGENEDKEEDVDLYEKFVRERFGKTESYEKRAAKLQHQRHIPVNPELQKQVDRILKRVDETGKQADKSGDPNAGYLWTLEYNENI